jgi:hypothetical protein
MNLSSINLRFFANIAPLVSGLNKAERAMDRAGKKMQAVGKNLTMKVTAPIVGLGAVAVNTFQGFELQMAKVKAVSGATGAEFEALSKNAKDLGASTIFSAKQVAELQTEFAKLGFTAAEITQGDRGDVGVGAGDRFGFGTRRGGCGFNIAGVSIRRIRNRTRHRRDGQIVFNVRVGHGNIRRIHEIRRAGC